MVIFNSYVKLPEGTNYGKSRLNHHFRIGSTISMAMYSKLLVITRGYVLKCATCETNLGYQTWFLDCCLSISLI
jgi:hypothetical protein